MSEFEERWDKEMARETNGSSLGPRGAITDTQVHQYEKGAAEWAWNAALEEIREALQIHDTMGDIKTEVNYLKTE